MIVDYVLIVIFICNDYFYKNVFVILYMYLKIKKMFVFYEYKFYLKFIIEF